MHASIMPNSSRLTWRDIQYLIAYTSNSGPLLTDSNHFVNGAGLTVSHQFGFGAIDAEAMVTRAQRWTNVPEQMSDSIIPTVDSGLAISMFKFSLFEKLAKITTKHKIYA